MESEKKINARSIFIKFAILGSVSLFLFYYLLLLLATKDPRHPFNQFLDLQPWMSLLVIGFGIQTGIYGLIKKGFRLNLSQKKDSQVAVGTGSAVSGLSMVACCAHHIVDVTPVLGISGAAIFLTEYQKELLILGIFANAIGILYMSWFYGRKQSPKTIMRYVFNRQEVAS